MGYIDMVLKNHSQKSVLTTLGIVCLWLGGISGDLYPTARARQHRGPSHRVTRQLVSDGDHAHELEIYVPNGAPSTADGMSVQSDSSCAIRAVHQFPTVLEDGGPLVLSLQSSYVAIDSSSPSSRGPPQFS
jgi:hypothetical protein